jgi:hypothetical protein
VPCLKPERAEGKIDDSQDGASIWDGWFWTRCYGRVGAWPFGMGEVRKWGMAESVGIGRAVSRRAGQRVQSAERRSSPFPFFSVGRIRGGCSVIARFAK